MSQQTASFGNSYENIQNLLLNNFTDVYCTFKDSSGMPVNVNTASGVPYLVVTDQGKDPSDPDKTIVSGALNYVTTGIYGYTLNPRMLEFGRYHLRFSGELQTVSPAVELGVEGAVQVRKASFEEDMMYRVRLKLKDVNVKLYQLDLPVQVWTDEEILMALYEALSEVNVCPPMRTNWSFGDVSSYGSGVDFLVTRAAFASLLESKAVLEAANTMTRSDGAANLTIQRSNIYSSMANSVRQDASRKIEAWKRSLVPKLMGQGTAQYPYQIRRAISFLPGFKNIFG